MHIHRKNVTRPLSYNRKVAQPAVIQSGALSQLWIHHNPPETHI